MSMILSEFYGRIKGIEDPYKVLPEMWEESGPDMVSRLDGLFCFVMKDNDTDDTFAARDRFGTRTMYFAHSHEGVLICGHSLKDVLNRSGIEPKPDRNAVATYIRMGFPSGRQTLCEQVQRLDSGSWLWSHNGKFEIRRYYQPSPCVHSEIPSQLWADRIHDTVSAICSEEQCKVSLLSSGIDSAYMTAMLPATNTYTVTFKERSELSGAVETTSILGIPNNPIMVTREEFLSYAEEALVNRELPTADASYIALYISMMKFDGGKVICSGEGVDELMLGYHHYEPLSGNIGGLISRQLFNCLESIGDETLPSLEAVSSASGVEFHFPFLDRRFADLCMDIPIDCKIIRNIGKFTFRRAVLNVLPASIAFRYKMGFPVPMEQWMKSDEWEPVIRNAITDGTLEFLAGKEAVEHCLNEDNWRKKWIAYTLVTWYKHFILKEK